MTFHFNIIKQKEVTQMEQSRERPYVAQQPPRDTVQPARPYSEKGKLEGVGNLLDGIDELVHKGSLADSYKQSGGQ